jgi:hypothetical protein
MHQSTFKDQVAREWLEKVGMEITDYPWRKLRNRHSKHELEDFHDRAATLFAEHERKRIGILAAKYLLKITEQRDPTNARDLTYTAGKKVCEAAGITMADYKGSIEE